VLSAARKDRFEQKTWWFPIVGHVPYKGYFNPKSALAAAEELEREGYDTYVRPTSAFSTLGWFDDPLLSTLLRADDVDLVSTVIHELAHNTLFVPSQVAFNESFASFVGDRGAIAFFCGIEGDDGRRCRIAQDRWADNLLFASFLQDLIARLEELYARTDLPRDSILARRDLIARRLYYDRLHLFEAAFERHGRDLPATIRAIAAAAAAERADPYGALDRMTAP
jgi:predicted aminopeptidase